MKTQLDELLAEMNEANPAEVFEGTIAELRAAVQATAQLVELVERLADPNPCRYDHNKSCQEHGHFGPGQCPHGIAHNLSALLRQPANPED